MTRFLVVSDIHSNLIALEAVLKDAGSYDGIISLGDIVGYGSDPNECVEIIKSQPNIFCVLGNHDYAAIGGLALDAFNAEARKSLLWQQGLLSQENLEFLRSLPLRSIFGDEATLAHGSPRDPIWEYVLNTTIARVNLGFFNTPWCFVGHSHFQVIFQYDKEEDDFSIRLPSPGTPYPLRDRAILNPGAVGQPRDRDPRAAYAFYEPEIRSWTPRRVEYDIPAAQKRIRDAALPSRHAERLMGGW